MIESLGSFEGKYEIIERIGEGGMGAVYKVKHTLLNEIRVIKTMRSHVMHQEENRERFFREARLAAKARHENIAQVFDFSVEGDVAFIVMEFIDGVTLQDILAKYGPPSLPLTLEIAQQSLRALAYVHKIDVIHRDISPDNLMLTSDSDGDPKIKLIDLGLAKPTEADGGLTREGFFLGKLRYASPEQFDVARETPVGTYSDVYSFGLVFYQLLTGRYPIQGRDLPELMAGHMTQPPMTFEESDPEGHVPAALRQVVLQALEKKPESRFRDGEAFRDRVLAIQADFPWGQKERKESIKLSERPPSRVEAAERPGSSQSRLGRAFPVDQSSAGLTGGDRTGQSRDGTATMEGVGGIDTTTPLPMKPDLPPPEDLDTAQAGTQIHDSSKGATRVREGTAARTEAGGSSKAGTMVGAGSRVATQLRDRRPPVRPTPEPVPSQAGAGTAEGDGFAISSSRPGATPVQRETTRKTWIVVAAAAVVVIGLAITLVLTGVIDLTGIAGRSEPPAVGPGLGTLVVRAVPWAEIVQISDNDGTSLQIEGSKYTPLVMPLAPGTYRIVARNADFGEKTVEAVIEADTTTTEVITLADLDEDQLLRSLRLID